MAEPTESATERTGKRRFARRRRSRSDGSADVAAGSKAFEAPTVEEALVAAADEFGPGVEVLDAERRRHGGVFGFFARQSFVVTARPRRPGENAVVPTGGDAAAPEVTFDAVLAAMADGVVDTVEIVNEAAEPAAEPVAEPAPQLPSRRRSRPTAAPAPSGIAGRLARADRAVGLIDLREGRRIPVDPIDSGTGVRERPSQLRRRRAAGGSGALGANPLTHEVPGSVLDLRDSKPDWSVDRLRRLGLGEQLLDLVAAFEPTSDLEWVQALATAIQVQMPDSVSPQDTLLAGDGRASAVGLVQGLAVGKIPAFLLIDGQQIPATADELALSIRECLR